jgi:hypothetical protein
MTQPPSEPAPRRSRRIRQTTFVPTRLVPTRLVPTRLVPTRGGPTPHTHALLKNSLFVPFESFVVNATRANPPRSRPNSLR